MTKVERKAQKVRQAQADYRKAVREQKNLHFKEQGQTFSQKLKRVMKADAGQPIS